MIVACERGGVCDEPPWLRAATRPLKMEKDGPTTGPVLLKQGEPGTSQYDIWSRPMKS